MNDKEAKKLAKKLLEGAKDFIIVSYSPDNGVNIHASVGQYAFAILGAIGLAKQNLMEGLKSLAEVEIVEKGE
jgi:hypothetical protein